MAAAADASRSAPSADSYVGSLISLTSKCEIRYEGILYNINTEESSIGLRNVRSFGTEGRKKDGPQVPAGDKIYEYILFRGSDIKDLQVKSSPPVQTTATSIHNDPAIIQSHYSRPVSGLTSPPSIGSGTATDLNSQTAQLASSRSTFLAGLPQYQPGANLGSWGSTPTPPIANGSGLGMPMYWPGFYAPTGSLPHVQQTPLLRPPPGLPIPTPMQQPLQYPGLNASLSFGSSNLPEFPSLLPPVSNAQGLTSTTLLSTLAPTQASVSAPETASNLMPNKFSVTSVPSITPNLPFAPPLTSSHDPVVTSQAVPSVVSSKPRIVPSPNLSYQTVSQAMPLIIGSFSASQVEPSVPLVTPGQLLQPGPSALPSSQPLQTSHKDVEAKLPEVKTKPSPREASVRAPAEAKEPILPLPKPTYHQKPNGAALHTHHYNRGRGRGRGNGYSRPLTRFTEDFDFMAMNEKFNKDEVWGHLGKNKAQSRDKGGAKADEDDDNLQEDDVEAVKVENKPVYVKDDFFDTLSSNTLDRENRGGRTKFSEQLKIDTETFGDFPRHRPNRGGGRGFRGGGRTRGSYYGRGYGYMGRGRGHAVSNRAS